MSWERLCLSFCVFAILACGIPVVAESADNPFTEARFAHTSDPTAMVLHVHYGGGLGGTFKSLSLYGDGRLVLKSGRRGTTLKEHEVTLSFDEAQRLISVAVEHGLAEWDGTAFNAKALEINNGKPLVVPTDIPTVTILLTLDEYDRGTYRLDNLKRQITFNAPTFINRSYPGIREVEGMVALITELESRLHAAEQSP